MRGLLGRGGFVHVETTVPLRFRGTSAKAFAEGFVARRLAACVNHWRIESSYWWKGRQETAAEVLLLFKTTRAAARQLVRALRAEHPYEVPYVAVMPLDVQVPSYATWLRAETFTRTERARRAR